LDSGPVLFADLFGDKQTLAVYSYMYGPQREQPCPMCTSLMAAWDGEALDIEQRIALVMVARSPIERLVAGYWLWELPSVDEAVAWVKRCPNPMPVPSEIEIRPI